MQTDPDIREDDPITVERLKVALEVVRNLRTEDPTITLGLNGANLSGMDLSGMDLSSCNMRQADLTQANLSRCNLRGVDLAYADLVRTNLRRADLSSSYLFRANMFGADLYEARVKGANLHSARLTGAGCYHADFTDCDLGEAQLLVVNMHGSTLRGANLLFTVFLSVDLGEADLTGAHFSSTVLSGVDLRQAVGLKKVIHDGPCHIGFDTISESRGCVPPQFLRRCGFQSWELLQAKLYTPDISPATIRGVCDRLFTERAGAGVVRRTFISYSHSDDKFVEKLRRRLDEEDVLVWLDKHELTAGGIQKQIARAMSGQDVVILVLSENSLESDWVENELEMAREKEKSEGRDVVCPIAIDNTWSKYITNENHPNRTLWRKLREKYVIDFSKWRTKAFEHSFRQLIAGVKLNYESRIK
jgi:uncharacterized protein YjbI with pentapeptide repeats